jgi:DNA mismatch repair protein MutL
LLAELARAGGRLFSERGDMVLATMACHGSLRSGDAVSAETAAALLNSLDDVDFAGHCPHGRPVLHRMAFSELEQKVGR